MTQSNQKTPSYNLKRASVPGAGASITIEAALVIPVFSLQSYVLFILLRFKRYG